MKRFRFRLTALFILLIGLSVLSSGIYMAIMLERSHLNALKESMFREIRVVMATVNWGEGLSPAAQAVSLQEQADRLKELGGARVTFIAEDGTVLADSDKAAGSIENHYDREELQGARQDGIGHAIRRSETVGRNLFYVAAPLQRADGATAGYVRMAASLDAVDASIRQLWSGLASGLAVLLLLAILVSFRLAKGLTRPLENITDVAKQITRMNYKSRVTNGGKDEIGQLGQAVNTMADSLQLQMNKIQANERRLKSVLDNLLSGIVMADRSGVVVLINRSAELILGLSAHEMLGRSFKETRQHQELIRFMEEGAAKKTPLWEEFNFYYPQERILETNLIPLLQHDGEWEGMLVIMNDITHIRRLEKMRSEFVANVSHELKTPIAAVKGFAETLLGGAMNEPDTARQFLQIIYDESDRLNRLIGDILELSKIESKRVPLQFSPIELHAFLTTTLEMMKKEAAAKRIVLQLEVEEGHYLEADEDRLRQIVINLLSNGINYTPEGGVVKVKLEPLTDASGEDEKLRIIISDTGIGIPKKDLPRIFERFYRVDKARSRSSGGTGLGLSIVKHLVELHHGTIRVDSEVGLGSRFIIELPVIQG